MHVEQTAPRLLLHALSLRMPVRTAADLPLIIMNQAMLVQPLSHEAPGMAMVTRRKTGNHFTSTWNRKQSLQSHPVAAQVHFNLSLGRAFGGTVVAKPIMLWLDPFLRTTLADLIVWPNRIVVPLSYDPDFDYSILEMRCGP